MKESSLVNMEFVEKPSYCHRIYYLVKNKAFGVISWSGVLNRLQGTVHIHCRTAQHE
jgi:hypothetical protein